MEDKYKFALNGQELIQADISDANAGGFASEAALADDRILWELLRLKPQAASPQKFILPWAQNGSGKLDSADTSLKNTALVQGETSDAKVRIMPFRAIIASQDTSSNKEKLRGIRSGYHIGSSSTLYTAITINANAAGNPRWTLVYAQVTPAANGSSVTRFYKDTTTGVVSSSSVVTTTKCTVTILQTDGTAAASPTRPSLPADGGGNFNIALAYIWVPNGFGGSSSVGRGAIHEVPSCASLHSATGVSNMQPANGMYAVGGYVDTRQGHNQALRPGMYLPPTMVGGERRIILIQRGLSPTGPNDGDVIDTTIDWRWRYFTTMIVVVAGSTTATAFASDRNLTGSSPTGTHSAHTLGTNLYFGGGQSFVDDSGVGIPVGDSNGVVLYVGNGQISQIPATNFFQIYVRNTDGALVFKVTNTGAYQAIVRIEATGQYSNFTAAL